MMMMLAAAVSASASTATVRGALTVAAARHIVGRGRAEERVPERVCVARGGQQHPGQEEPAQDEAAELAQHGATRQLLEDLFHWLLEPCLWYVRKACKAPVPTSDIMLAQALMRLLDSHLDEWRVDEGEGEDDKKKKDKGDAKKAPDAKKGGELLQGFFIFSLVWAVGATVDEAGRGKFDAFLRQLLKRETPEILASTPGAPQPQTPADKTPLAKLARPLRSCACVWVCGCVGVSGVGWLR